MCLCTSEIKGIVSSMFPGKIIDSIVDFTDGVCLDGTQHGGASSYLMGSSAEDGSQTQLYIGSLLIQNDNRASALSTDFSVATYYYKDRHQYETFNTQTPSLVANYLPSLYIPKIAITGFSILKQGTNSSNIGFQFLGKLVMFH